MILHTAVHLPRNPFTVDLSSTAEGHKAAACLSLTQGGLKDVTRRSEVDDAQSVNIRQSNRRGAHEA